MYLKSKRALEVLLEGWFPKIKLLLCCGLGILFFLLCKQMLYTISFKGEEEVTINSTLRIRIESVSKTVKLTGKK